MQNFASLAEALLRDGGAVKISDAGELQDAIAAFLSSSDRRLQSNLAARRCLEIHRGATNRTIDLLQGILLRGQAQG